MSLITYVTRIHFAENVLEDALEHELDLQGVTRPLIVCDRGQEDSGPLGRLLAAIPKESSPRLFVARDGDATEKDCEAAAAICREHACDGIIGFGSGAAIDLAKCIAVRVTHEGPLRPFAGVEGGQMRIRDVLPPLLAIPTTAGAGAEASSTAAIVMDDGPKLTLVSPFLVPRVALCDPTLTLDLPADATASSGMDALTHCIETFIASAFNPPADGIALDGVRRIAANLERAVEEGANIKVRREMMAAALNGALAQQKGLGGVHAMSHGLGALGSPVVQHGAINAVLLPYALEFNAPAAAHRYAELRRVMNVKGRVDLPEAVARLRERVGLPGRLRDIGLDRRAIARASTRAACDYTNRTNPRRASADDYRSLMLKAL